MKTRKSPREELVEEVVGYEKAIASIALCAACFDESNGVGRMSVKGLRAFDLEGSGEYYEARCLNSNEATCGAEEVYEIVSGC